MKSRVAMGNPDLGVYGLDQWFSKFFSHSSLPTQTLSILPQQRSHMIIATISNYLLWRNNRRLSTRQTQIISDTAIKVACNCKLLRLLPYMWNGCLIMELLGHCSFTLHRHRQTKQVTMAQERRPTGIRRGTPSLLHLWPANRHLHKVCIC